HTRWPRDWSSDVCSSDLLRVLDVLLPVPGVEHVQRLEQVEEHLKREVEIPNKFIIPGDTSDGAALDLARAIIRRAERMAVKLLRSEERRVGKSRRACRCQ